MGWGGTHAKEPGGDGAGEDFQRAGGEDRVYFSSRMSFRIVRLGLEAWQTFRCRAPRLAVFVSRSRVDVLAPRFFLKRYETTSTADGFRGWRARPGFLPGQPRR